jgi:chromosome segregation ATPase
MKVLLNILICCAINTITAGGDVHVAREKGLQFQLDDAKKQNVQLKQMIVQLQDQLKREIETHEYDVRECKQLLNEKKDSKQQISSSKESDEELINATTELRKTKQQLQDARAELQKTKRTCETQLQEYANRQSSQPQTNWEGKYKKCAAVLLEAQANTVPAQQVTKTEEGATKKLALLKKQHDENIESWRQELEFQTKKSDSLQSELNKLKSAYRKLQLDYQQCEDVLRYNR